MSVGLLIGSLKGMCCSNLRTSNYKCCYFVTDPGLPASAAMTRVYMERTTSCQVH